MSTSASSSPCQHSWQNDRWLKPGELVKFNPAIIERQEPPDSSGVFYHGQCALCDRGVVREVHRLDPILDELDLGSFVQEAA